MGATRGRDNPRERLIRSGLHRLGYRFGLHAAPVADFRRTADIVLRVRKIAVFLDGCFWHGCPRHATWPKRNAGWWREKLLRNAERDRETTSRLRAEGWRVIRVWDHVGAAEAIARIVSAIERKSQKIK